MRVQTVARHELDLFFAADDALRVRVPCERDGLQLLAEEERRIVLETLALAHDDVPLGLGLLDGDERVAHAVRLELERDGIALRGHRLEVAGHILAGERVPERAVSREKLVEVALRMLGRALEEHVLEEVRHTGGPGHLISSAHLIPDPERNDGRVPRLERVHHQPVIEAARGGGVSNGGDANKSSHPAVWPSDAMGVLATVNGRVV